jgi:UDP-glucose 4-epimerase
VSDERFGGRRILVTGGLGFIGSAIARALVARGARVTIVDNLAPGCGGTYANVSDIVDEVEIVEADLLDTERILPALEGCEIVFNLAGHTSHIDSMLDPQTDLRLNCAAQVALLDACRAVGRPTVVFAGTRQIYGRPRYLPVDEDHPIEPVDVNGIHQAAGEHYHLLYGRLYDLPVCVLRLTNTYGPGMRVRDARQTFLGVWLAALVRGEEFEIWGDGSQIRDFTYVDDAVRAFLDVALEPDARGRVFNLGDERTVTLRELADLAVAANGGGSYRIVPFPADRKAIDIGDYAGDYRALRSAIVWRPKVALEDGLARTLADLRARGSQYW